MSETTPEKPVEVETCNEASPPKVTSTPEESSNKSQPEVKNSEEVTKSPEAKSPADSATSPADSATSPADSATSPNGATGGSACGKSFKENFKAFSKFGDTKSDGKLITLSQSDKWMKQAGVIDGKKITTTDTGIYFKKFKVLKIGIADYEKFMEELAKNKKIEVADLKSKMAACGVPGLTGTGPPKVAGAVDRLTDVSKYTGSHKQRFDQTGKGRGIAGRKDLPDSSGYVQGYQNKDSYSKTH